MPGEKYEKICGLIKTVDAVNQDSIIVTRKIRDISDLFRKVITDEHKLSAIFKEFNNQALEDGDFGINFIHVFTSRQLEDFEVNGNGIRNAILIILQRNFQDGPEFQKNNLTKFYNSLTMLGEYYNIARLATGAPINVLGESLFQLLSDGLEAELKTVHKLKDSTYAKLILSQVSLNGNLAKPKHKKEIEQLLFNIRRCLIEIDCLDAPTKSFLLMTVDLYHSNIQNGDKNLEKMYQQYLLEYETKRKKDSSPKPQSSKDKLGKSVVHKNKPKEIKDKKVKIVKRTEEDVPVNWDEDVPPKVLSPKTPEGSPPSKSPEPSNKPQESDIKVKGGAISKSEPAHQKLTKSVPQKLPDDTTTASKELVEISKVTENSIKSDISLAAEETVTVKAETNGHHLTAEQLPSSLPETSKTAEFSEDVKLNGNSEEAAILKQQNSQLPPLVVTPKTKVQKVYFREENTENLTWTPNLEELDTSPKVNPFSKSFLTFLGSNN